jgi:hypothetical protein
MRVGIYLFEQFHGREGLGSSKIRGHWLVKNWPEAEIFKMGQQYDVIIYQKVYHVEHAKSFTGFKILDLCDPDWLHWAYKTKQMIEEVDVITTSTEALAIALRQITDKPVFCIPDRIDLSLFETKKFHVGEGNSVAWFGYSDNYPVLERVISILNKNNFKLIVVSDGNFNVSTSESFKMENYKYKDATAYNDIMRADIVINPQMKKGKWKFKSNNKTLVSWALGLPVAENEEDLIRFRDINERKKEVEFRTRELNEKWDIKLSVKQYKDIINQYCIEKE